jgi:hypothetical protein
MREILKDAIDSEPIFKYSFFVIKWSVIIGFFAVWFTISFVWNFLMAILDSPSPTTSAGVSQSKWLIDCALQEQWQRDHQ